MFRPRRRHYGGRGGGGMGLVLLAMQLFSFFNFLSRSDRYFPVTLAVMALNVVVHLRPRVLNVVWPSLQQACISVRGVWLEGEWKRLFSAPFVHGNDFHLYYNMASFMWKAVSLERHFGSNYFLYMVGVFSVVTNLVYLVINFTLAEVFDQWSYIQSCAVGFSGVLFALKVVTTYLEPNNITLIMGFFPIPMRLACWAELVITSVLFPNVSFIGHLSGILVGLAFVTGPLKYLMDVPVSMLDTGTGFDPQRFGDGQGSSYTYRAASTGYRAARHDGGDSEEEELQEAIRMSLHHHKQQENQITPSAPPSKDSHAHTDTELELAIQRSLEDHVNPQPPMNPPPPINPSYSPSATENSPEGTIFPSHQGEPEEMRLRKRHGTSGDASSDVAAMRAARLLRFERRN